MASAGSCLLLVTVMARNLMIPRSTAIGGRLFTTTTTSRWTLGPTVEFLAGLAGERGGVLELGIGTGRVALAAGGPGDQGGRGLTPRPRDGRSGCGPSQAASRSLSPSGIWPRCPSAAGSGWVYLVFNTLFGLLSQETAGRVLRQRGRERSRPGGIARHRVLSFPDVGPVRPRPRGSRRGR